MAEHSEGPNMTEIIATMRAYSGLIKFGFGLAVVAAAIIFNPWGGGSRGHHGDDQIVQGGTLVNSSVTSPNATNFLPGPGSPTAQQSLTFVVASVGQNRSGSVKYLNSKPNYREPGNQAIALSGAAATVNQQVYVGKTVSASGPLSFQAGGQTVNVTDLSQLKSQ